MKKPNKTAAELEASIKVEMEDICDWPTDMAITVQPDFWKVAVTQEGSVEDADRREMVEQIAARLRAEYDLRSRCPPAEDAWTTGVWSGARYRPTGRGGSNQVN